MKHSRSKVLYSAILAFVITAIAGCGNSSDKWLDAGGVELIYEAQIRMDAVNAGLDQFAADKSCEAMLPMAKKSLSDSSSVAMAVQIMDKTCNDAGLEFQNDVRCEADRLQVLCR
jgi:hypothetical protein